jgi:hypothetical protein
MTFKQVKYTNLHKANLRWPIFFKPPSPFTFPTVRAILQDLIATELVNVQPMSGPIGLAYALRFKYGEKI